MGFKKDNERYYMASVRLGPKGQIVIPKDAREMFGLEPGDQLVLLADELDFLFTRSQQVIYKLLDWPQSPLSRLVVIVPLPLA